MALEPLTRRSASLLALIATASVAFGCSRRNVFLVPESTGSGGMPTIHVQEAGMKPSGRPDSGNPPEMGGQGGTDSGTPPEDAGHAACVTEASQAPQPLGVYVLVDQSNAMLTQWNDVSSGLQTFMAGGIELGGVSIGIQYYAMSPQGLGADPYLNAVCDWKSYETPDVAIAPLPQNQMSLTMSIDNHGPLSLKQLFDSLSLSLGLLNESPIDAALQGAIQGARDWMASRAVDHPAAAVLLVTNTVASATDSPRCQPTVDKARAAAMMGMQDDGHGIVPTYVLNVGAPNADLDAIAMAGGTNAAYPVTNGAGVVGALLNIRQVVLPCDVTLSVAQEDLTGGTLNVELHETGKPAVRYGRVNSAADCAPAATPGEWYVEGTGADAKIKLCPSTCNAARSVTDARLDIVKGCQTTVFP